MTLTPYAGTLIAALRFGHVPVEMSDDLDFVYQCPDSELKCMRRVEELCVDLIEWYPKMFKKFTVGMNGRRVKISFESKTILYPYIHISVLHPTDPTLESYSHITADALENQETCFLSGRKWKCSKSGVLLLLNIGGGEKYGATCPLFPDHHSRVLPPDIVKYTWELNMFGYASFYNLFTTKGRAKLQDLSKLYHPERFVPPLVTTLQNCKERLRYAGRDML